MKNTSDDIKANSHNPVSISIVIPAYNEELRLPVTLLKTVDYLEEQKQELKIDSYEIIVVDDGSTDGTSHIVEQFSKLNTQVSCLSLINNRGKGEAVRQGILKSHGDLVLFMDADGATPIEELSRLLNAIREGADLAFGSRAVDNTETTVRTLWYRKLMGRIFNFLVNIILLPEVLDTQCGFKIFTNKCARQLFSRQTQSGFCFDVEILYLARKSGFKSKEVAVNWINIPGSKVRVIQHSLKMFLELFLIKFRHR